jgi:hypothetical protein
VKVARAETIAAAAPQQRKALPAELSEERRKVRDDQGSEARGCRRQRDDRGGGRRCSRGCRNIARIGRCSGRRGIWGGCRGNGGRRMRGRRRAAGDGRRREDPGSADGLDRRRQPRKVRRLTREPRGELCSLAVALHCPLFERLNPLARLSVDIVLWFS